MIIGIGTDLCDVRRITATLARKGDRFAEKVLGPDELKVFHARRAKVDARGVRFLATRFSAKEAFSKAVGMGLHMPMTWRSCALATNFTWAPQCAHMAELPGSMGLTTARLDLIVVSTTYLSATPGAS